MRAIGTLSVATGASAAAGAGYSTMIGGMPAIGLCVGAAIGGGITILELFIVQGHIGAPMRRMPLPIFILSVSLLWTVIVLVGLTAVSDFVEMIFLGAESDGGDFEENLLRDFVFAFVVVLILNAAMRIRTLIGPRVLGNFLIGRYYRPRREERVFLFLDLKGSSRLAERLGDIEVQNLIAAFFFDIARPIARHGGETHRYIGDEVVVTWPMEEALSDARCLACIKSIRATADSRAEVYRKRFGVAPEYRLGLHGGPVVAREIGDGKREIVYFGDTINTAARVAAMTREVGQDALISDDLLQRMTLPAGITTVALGTFAIRGKEESLAISALTIQPSDR